MASAEVLKRPDIASEQVEIYAEQERPAWVQAVKKVQPVIRAQDLAFFIFDKPNLAQTEEFMTDFGLVTASRNAQVLEMRGAGTKPVVYMARAAAKAKFAGMVFVAANAHDLDTLKAQCNAQDSAIASHHSARGVCMRDPGGFEVHVIHGWRSVPEMALRGLDQPPANKGMQVSRVNSSIRPAFAPAQVLHSSHVVLQTKNFATSMDWYMKTLGLIASDVQYLPDGSPNLVFMRLDLGDTPADHHTVVIAGGVEEAYMHSAYEVLDLDAIGQGHQYMRGKGWRHAWGMGRHYLGSQLFDYWFDPDGHEVEHMADSDKFDSSIAPGYSPFDRKSLWMWGQDVPKHMAPPKNPVIILGVIFNVLRGVLDGKRIGQIVKSLGKKPRSWIS